MPPATRRYARIKLSTTRRSSVGSLARICSTVGSGLDPCRTSATALPSPDSRLALWRVVAKEAWQSADATWCVVAPAPSAIECRPLRLRGTNLGDAATDREARIATSQRSANGPNCSWACAPARPRVGSEVEPPRLTYAPRCGTETVPTAPKGCWMAKKRSL